MGWDAVVCCCDSLCCWGRGLAPGSEGWGGHEVGSSSPTHGRGDQYPSRRLHHSELDTHPPREAVRVVGVGRGKPPHTLSSDMNTLPSIPTAEVQFVLIPVTLVHTCGPTPPVMSRRSPTLTLSALTIRVFACRAIPLPSLLSPTPFSPAACRRPPLPTDTE
jgi:hypothetical protein